jgi:hypothetical protein
MRRIPTDRDGIHQRRRFDCMNRGADTDGTTLALEMAMVRSPDEAQRNPGISTEAVTVVPGMRCAPSGLPTSPSFGASAVFPINGA